jgi:hypothetical protein
VVGLKCITEPMGTVKAEPDVTLQASSCVNPYPLGLEVATEPCECVHNVTPALRTSQPCVAVDM